MYLKQTCGKCQKTLKFPEESVGRKVRCPYCHNSVLLQRAERAATESQSSTTKSTEDSERQEASTSGAGEPEIHNVVSAASDVSMLWSGLIALCFTVGFYGLIFLMKDLYLGKLFLARGWVPFALTFLLGWSGAILILKGRKLMRQRESMLLDLLPNEIGSTITTKNLDKFAAHIRKLPADPKDSFLINRVLRGLEHFRVRRNSAEVATVLSSQSDIDANSVTSSYAIVKVFLWAIPILGFIGTVIGISDAVGGFSGSLGKASDLGALKESLNSVTGGLGTAFDTTLVALVLSMLIMFPTSSMQKSEEDLLNWVDEYCNENLIRRLDDKDASQQAGGSADYAKAVQEAVKQAMVPHLAEIQSWSQKLDAISQNLTQQISKAWSAVYKDQAKEFAAVADRLSTQTKQLEERSTEQQSRIEAGLSKAVEQFEQSLGKIVANSESTQQQVASSMQKMAGSLEPSLKKVVEMLEQTMSKVATTSEAAQQRTVDAMEQAAGSVEGYCTKLEAGLTSLNDVLTELGGQQIVVEKKEPSRRGWSLFGRRNGGH